jgi:hypothetical protein
MREGIPIPLNRAIARGQLRGCQVLVSVLQRTIPPLLLLFAIAPGAAAAETRRLGICATGQPAEESLSELLTVDLSQDESIELVERDQIRAIRRELRSAAPLGANGHQSRLRLGRQLNADFLAWLSVVDTRVDGRPTQSAKFLRLIVSDCVYGARLRIEYFPFESDHLPETRDKCAAVIRKTLADFSGDVHCLVTVPPFVSRNLTRRHDSLQDAYAILLQMAMLQIPGVAVLEVDEARSIRDELLLAGREIEAPAVPLFIQGEFETTGQAPDCGVRLLIQVLSGDTAQNAIEERMPLGEAPDFLRSRAAGRVLPLGAESLRAPSREQQRRWIAERAELFSRLGSVDQAIALQETALLLEPDDAEQRLALLDECHRRYLTGDWETSLRAQLKNEPKESVDQRIRDAHRGLWERRMQHVEYLLRNRQVNPREAGYLIASTTDYWLRPRQRSYRVFSRSPGLEDQPLAQAFFWRTVPLIAELDYDVARGVVRRGFEEYYDHINLKDIDWEPAEQNSRWITATGKSLLKFRYADEPNGEMDPRVLEQLYRLLTEVAPRDAVP